MECLAGETLAERLRRGPLALKEALEAASQIASALSAAHRAGIVHRDLKPGNVMLTETGVRLLDFGLARHPDAHEEDMTTAGGLEPLTGTGTIVGTLPYMAPEQIEGRTVDARTDIFAFGVVLYEMVTGRRAFDAPSRAALIGSILRDYPPSLRSVDPTLPTALDRAICRCLAKDPEARWQSVDEIQAALTAAGPVRRRWVPIAAGAIVTVAVVFVLVAVSQGTRSVPKVKRIHRLTHDPTIKETPYSDATHVYYTYWRTGLAGTSVFQVPITGGDSIAFETPFGNPYLYDIAPTRGELLLSDKQGSQLYTMSTIGGQPRPVGQIRADWAAVSHDGRRIAFSRGRELFVSAVDGSGVRRLLTSPDLVYEPRWSRDDRRIRYTAVANQNEHALWEVSAEGTGAHELLPGWKVACCGAWTLDGRYFVFEAERDGDYGLWVLPEQWPWWRGGTTGPLPVKLTDGPMRYENAMPSSDGRIFLALGTAPSTGELVRFDKRSGQFVTMLSGLNARDLDFSRDGQWITYVNHADSTIWRSRSDGTD